MNHSIINKAGLGKAVSGGIFPSAKSLNKIAKQVGLIKRIRIVTAPILLFSLIQAVAFSERSCRAVALSLGIQADIKISRQAIWKILKRREILPFLEKIIGSAVAKSMEESSVLKLAKNTSTMLNGINRIIVGDGSSFKLHSSLAAVFEGAKNFTTANVAQLKLQLSIDLITGEVIHFSLDPYRRSDAKAAFDIIPKLQSGDLLIRDLGYSSAPCFQAIQDMGAYFLSRLKSDYSVFNQDENQIDLVKKLNTLASSPGDIIRMPIKITSNQFSCVLVAIRVPDEVANERRRKLKEKAQKASKPAPRKETLERQNWTLLITNMPNELADNKKIQQLYLLRWRIEMIFKACKSHSGFLKVACHKTNQNHAKALILAWVLIIIVLARFGGFALGRLKEVFSPAGGMSFELEIHNESLFKTLQKKIYMLGFYLELVGCGNPAEHFRRTEAYNSVHNKTELTPKRTALSEILTDVLELERSPLSCH